MKSFACLVVAALACAQLHGSHMHADAAATAPEIVCDGSVLCADTYEPVCTSNGRTYRNECEFKNAYCENPKKEFYIVSQGACENDGGGLQVQSIGEDEDGGEGVTATVLDVPIDLNVNETPSLPPLAGADLPDCTDGQVVFDATYDPVCTSTGRTYRNQDEYRNAYCDKPRPSFVVVSKGECDETATGQFQALSVDDENDEGEQVEFSPSVFDVPIELDTPAAGPVINCDGTKRTLSCGDKYEPVCTSYGRTYRNDCEFQNAYCEAPSAGFYVVSKGQCESDPLQVLSDESEVSAEVINVPIEIDEDVGNEVGATVIDIGTAPSIPAPPTPSQRPNLYCALTCATGEMVVAPLCGTDARSYINDCHLLASKCEQPDLEKQYDGLCTISPPQGGGAVATGGGAPTGGAARGSAGRITVQEVGASKPKCNSFCTREYQPVCGSNGITYANQCLFDYASCQNSRIVKLGDGKCATLVGANFGKGTKDSKSPCVPSVCPSTDAQVCGSDGMTYLNVCLLGNAQCQNPELTLLHDGACGEDTTLTCGSLTCPRYTECREEPGTQVAYCAEVCHPDRCAPHETCKLLNSECYTAPCSPVATCVSNGDNENDEY